MEERDAQLTGALLDKHFMEQGQAQLKQSRVRTFR
jgi:hypothetical protein